MDFKQIGPAVFAGALATLRPRSRIEIPPPVPQYIQPDGQKLGDILIWHDNNRHSRSLGNQFSANGFQVRVANSYKEFLGALEHKPEMVLVEPFNITSKAQADALAATIAEKAPQAAFVLQTIMHRPIEVQEEPEDGAADRPTEPPPPIRLYTSPTTEQTYHVADVDLGFHVLQEHFRQQRALACPLGALSR